MLIPRGYLRYLSASWCALCVTALVMLALPRHSAADEVDGRPWGRLSKPSLSAPASSSQRGYRGRYNPWSSEGRSDSKEPRYRQRDDAAASNVPPFNGYHGYPPRQPYTPSPPPYPAYGPLGGAPYAAPSPSPYSGMAPWGGGLNPNYGGYWNDPYNTLQPDRGILWSDMWR
jgi:hypothetical protein